MSQLIRVVVVDDSALMRRVITDLLQQDSAIQVVGAARNGREAIELVKNLRPNIVTMDVRMPVMDGLATTEHLMAYCPTPILVVTASLAKHDVDITFKMLAAGALEVFEKPSASDAAALERAGRALIRRVKILSRVKVVTHLRGRRKPTHSGGSPNAIVVSDQGKWEAGRQSGVAREIPTRPAISLSPRPAVSTDMSDFPIVVIGASTGGPRVVNQVLAALPGDLPAAILVVQHIAAGFSTGFAEWLAHASKLPVVLAHEGKAIRAGEVLVAPDQRDLLITPDRRVHLSANPLLIQRPSIDISMQAAAEVFRSRSVGILLTGMGRDGAYGMLTIKRAGGHTIAQDETSSTIFGMPRAAIQLGAAQDVLPVAEITGRLVQIVLEMMRPTVANAGGGPR
jgi:two-component system chemotaxis response regulator CheB